MADVFPLRLRLIRQVNGIRRLLEEDAGFIVDVKDDAQTQATCSMRPMKMTQKQKRKKKKKKKKKKKRKKEGICAGFVTFCRDFHSTLLQSPPIGLRC